MSSGASHYRRAEQLEQLAAEQWEKDTPLWRLTIQRAQVHATLALAAATAEPIAKSYDGDDFREYARAWSAAIS